MSSTPVTAIPAPETERGLSHDWIGAATVKLTLAEAKRADLRGSFRAAPRAEEPNGPILNRRIDVLEVYCADCKRIFEEVRDEPCSAKINNEHLRGGPIGERAKRKVAKPNPDSLIPGEKINRRGTEAFALGGDSVVSEGVAPLPRRQQRREVA